jgi:hypothetical protein
MNTVTVDKATWMRQSDGFYVAFRVQEPKVGEEMCRLLADGKPRELTVRAKKRSLDANAYAWMLMGKLAAKLRLTPEEVYRSYIPDVGDNYTIMMVLEEAVDDFREQWCRGHLGREVTDLGPSGRFRKCHNILCYYGSSDYDREQMSRLIDLIVADCKEQGIETLSERERSLLVEKWGQT